MAGIPDEFLDMPTEMLVALPQERAAFVPWSALIDLLRSTSSATQTKSVPNWADCETVPETRECELPPITAPRQPIRHDTANRLDIPELPESE
jgi:hypothetical protein